jgi:hypothetical protein
VKSVANVRRSTGARPADDRSAWVVPLWGKMNPAAKNAKRLNLRMKTMCDCEPAELFDESRIRKSRKDHKCCECGIILPKGSPYIRSVGKWNGEFDRFVTCEACHALSAYIMRISGCCHNFRMLHAEVHEAFRDGVMNNDMRDFLERRNGTGNSSAAPV